MFHHVVKRCVGAFGHRRMFNSSQLRVQQRRNISSRNRFAIFTQYANNSLQLQPHSVLRLYLNVDPFIAGLPSPINRRSSILSGGTTSTNLSLDLDCAILDDDDDGLVRICLI
jgi:hypothetical protein